MAIGKGKGDLLTLFVSQSKVKDMKKIKPTLTYSDIEWLKSELVPAMADRVKSDLSQRLDWIITMLDKQAGKLQSIETELTLIRGALETNSTNLESLTKRVENLEKNVHITPLAD